MASPDLPFVATLARAIARKHPVPKSMRATAGASFDVLDQKCLNVRIAALNAGPNGQEMVLVEGLGEQPSVVKVNHFVVYLIHDDHGMVRFSMEFEQATNTSHLVIKCYKFTNSSTVTLQDFDLPWIRGEKMRTIGDIVIALEMAKVHQFTMTPDGEGCRSWVEGAAGLFIRAGFTHFLGSYPPAKFAPIDPKKHSAERVREISLQRLDEVLGWWFVRDGHHYTRPIKPGHFQVPLPDGPGFLEMIAER